MRTLLTIALTIFLSTTVFGTSQTPDKIIYKGKEYMLYTNPLESYFEKYPDKRPEGDIMSTSLWRGYVATFEIIDNQLFIKYINIEISTKDEKGNDKYSWKSVLNEVFPNQELVKIDWMTGLLVLPYGKIVNYVHMGYASTYENYILLEIDKGNLKTEKSFDYEKYEEFKEKQFQAFKKTEEYEKMKADIKKDDEYNWSDKEIDSFLQIFVIEYTSKILVEEDKKTKKQRTTNKQISKSTNQQ